MPAASRFIPCSPMLSTTNKQGSTRIGNHNSLASIELHNAANVGWFHFFYCSVLYREDFNMPLLLALTHIIDKFRFHIQVLPKIIIKKEKICIGSR